MAQPKLVSHQSSIWCQSINQSSNFQVVFFYPFYILDAEQRDKQDDAIERHRGCVLAVNGLSSQVAHDTDFYKQQTTIDSFKRIKTQSNENLLTADISFSQFQEV